MGGTSPRRGSLWSLAGILAILLVGGQLAFSPTPPASPGVEEAVASVEPSPGPAGAFSLGLPAQVVPVSMEVHTHTYGGIEWRVVHGTGNCCELYVAATPDGRIYDAGGHGVHFSEDGGVTWQRVELGVPLRGGEGAVAYAPGGDVLAVLWSYADGDQLLAVKYDASSDSWSYLPQPLREPLFDRPWLGVFKGPFTIGGTTAEYVALLRGGSLYRGTFMYSLDGLTYTAASDPLLSSFLGSPVKSPLVVLPDPDLDWLQPILPSGLTPAGPGSGLSARVDAFSPGGCPWRRAAPNGDWTCFDTPSSLGNPSRRLLVDAQGRLHQLKFGACASGSTSACFTYRWSSDGGATWGEDTRVVSPDGAVEHASFQVSAAHSLGLLTLHVDDRPAGVDRTVLFKYEGFPPVLAESLQVGLGDFDFGQGIGAAGQRLDFLSSAILPGGKVALAFGDSAHLDPALAIER